jgi:opacity protein-like surface antigen
MTARIAAVIASLLASAALAATAHAQARDLKTWGGPPNIGLDFKTGNSYGVSDFGAAGPEKPKKRRVVRARGNRKTPPTDTAAGRLKNPPLPEPNPARLAASRAATQTASTKAPSDITTDASPVETGTLAPLDTGPVPCRKYDPTTGRTIEVRCR